MRQIRLEDDVTALVEDYQQAEGLRSLSAAANRMLRLAAGPEPEPEPLAVPANATVTIGVPSRRIEQYGTTASVLTNGCQHPALARRGPLCGLCGATIG